MKSASNVPQIGGAVDSKEVVVEKNNLDKVNHQASKYFNNFQKELHKNLSFIDALSELIELEKKQGNFDHVAHWFNMLPHDLITDGIFSYSHEHRKREQESDVSKLQEHVVFTLKQYLEGYKNRVQVATADQAVGFQIFANQVASAYLLGEDSHSLNDEKEQTAIRAKYADDKNIGQYLSVLKDNTQKGNQYLSVIRENMRAFHQGQETFKASLDLIHNIKKEMIADAKIPQYIEKGLKILNVKITPELKNIIQVSDKVQKSMSLVNTFMIEQREKNRSKEQKGVKAQDFSGLMTAFGFVGELANQFGFKDLGFINKIGSAIAMADSAFSVLSSLSSFSLGPVVGMCGIIVSIFNMFGSDEDNSSRQDEMRQLQQYEMRQLQQFFVEMLEKYCAELHKHLDFIHDDLSKKIILGFEENRRNQGNIIDFLRHIHHDIKNHRIEARDRLDTLSDAIQAISVVQRNESRTKRLAEIYKCINLSTGPHQLSGDGFILQFNEYKTELCNLHKKDFVLTGIKGSKATMLKELEKDAGNIFGQDFNIASFQSAIRPLLEGSKAEKELINPSVYSWQLLGFMELLKSRYRKDEKADHFITKSEVKVLEEILLIAKDTQDFCLALRDKKLLDKLLSNYIEKGSDFLKQLKIYISKSEDDIGKKLHASFIKNINGLDGELTGGFESQEIEFDSQAKEYWFSGTHYYHHDIHGGDNGNPQSTWKNLSSATYELRLTSEEDFNKEVKHAEKPVLVKYQDGSYKLWGNKSDKWQLTELTDLKEVKNTLSRWNYLGKETRLINTYDPRFKVLNKDHQHRGYIGYIDKVYAYVENYYTARKQSVQSFQSKYSKQFSDFLAQSQIKGKSIIETNFSFDVSQLKINSHYYYAYVHPKRVLDKREDYTIILPLPQHYKFKIPKMLQIAEWLEAGVVGFEYSVVLSENSYKFILDCCFIIDNAKHVISSLSTPFDPSIYKGNEALWWWWVGGNFAKDASAYSYPQIYKSSRQPEGEWYTTHAYIPTCRDHVGRRDEIRWENGKQLHAEEKIHLSEDSALLTGEILTKIKNKISEHIRKFNSDLNRDIVNNEHSELAFALMDYSFSFYLLKYALSFSFGNHNLKLIPELSFLSDKVARINDEKVEAPAIRNRLDLITYLTHDNAKEFSLLKQLEGTLDFIRNKLPRAFDRLFDVPKAYLSDSLLDESCDHFSQLIAWYKPRSLEENQLVTTSSRAKLQEEENKILLTIIQATGNALLGLPEEYQRKVVDDVRKTMSASGISLPGRHMLFLPAPVVDKPQYDAGIQAKVHSP